MHVGCLQFSLSLHDTYWTSPHPELSWMVTLCIYVHRPTLHNTVQLDQQHVYSSLTFFKPPRLCIYSTSVHMHAINYFHQNLSPVIAGSDSQESSWPIMSTIYYCLQGRHFGSMSWSLFCCVHAVWLTSSRSWHRPKYQQQCYILPCLLTVVRIARIL